MSLNWWENGDAVKDAGLRVTLLSAPAAALHKETAAELMKAVLALSEATTASQVQALLVGLCQRAAGAFVQQRVLSGHTDFGSNPELEYARVSTHKFRGGASDLGAPEAQMLQALRCIEGTARLMQAPDKQDYEPNGRGPANSFGNEISPYYADEGAPGETSATYAVKQMATILPLMVEKLRPQTTTTTKGPSVQEYLTYMEYLKQQPNTDEVRSELNSVQAALKARFSAKPE